MTEVWNELRFSTVFAQRERTWIQQMRSCVKGRAVTPRPAIPGEVQMCIEPREFRSWQCWRFVTLAGGRLNTIEFDTRYDT